MVDTGLPLVTGKRLGDTGRVRFRPSPSSLFDGGRDNPTTGWPAAVSQGHIVQTRTCCHTREVLSRGVFSDHFFQHCDKGSTTRRDL